MLFTFYEDGFTHNGRVYLQGQSVDVDVTQHKHFMWSAEDQIKAYGKVFYRQGAWDGPLFDTEDPILTPLERERLEAANAEIIETREKAAVEEPIVVDEAEKPAPPKRRGRPKSPTIVNT